VQSFVKSNYTKIKGHRHYAKALHWTKLVSLIGGAQLIVQLTGLLTGIFLTRFLPTREYALYTIANAMLATMTVLSDGGISSGVMALGGKVWKDKQMLGKVLATGIGLRRQFAVFSLLVTLPILAYLLLRQDAKWWEITIIIVTLIPAFFAALSDSLLQVVPKLHQNLKPLQKNQVVVNVLRLGLSFASVFFFPFTGVALLANGIPRIYGNFELKKIASKFTEPATETDPAMRKEILTVVKRILPGSIYFCISGQISVWLISLFGSTDSVASIGALGRFSMLLSLFTLMFGMLLIPRFARLEENKGKLLKFFVSVTFMVTALSVGIIGFFYLFSEQFLWILGDQYKGLNKELVLTITASCLSMMSGLFFGLSSSRGKPTSPWLIIVGNILFVILGCILFNIKELEGVLYFNIFINTYPIAIHIFNFYYKIYYSK